MMSPLTRVAGALREPAYTGSNRCLPCTVLNIALVGIAAGAVGVRVPAAGIATAAVGVAVVWARGYVVPGTPRLTRRYLPAGALRWFGKANDRTDWDGTLQSATGDLDVTDPAEALAGLDVITDAGEPALTSSFRSAWADVAATLAADDAALRSAVGETLDAPADHVVIDHEDGGGVTLRVDGDWAGQWPSRTALIADLATERVLDGSDWTALDRTHRADLAARIRGLAARCPVCGASTRVSEATVESCCRRTEVVAAGCPTCDDRLAEFEPDRDEFAPGL